MKKTIAILLVLAMVLSMIPLSGVFAVSGDYLYLKPNSNWTQANARFSVYWMDSSKSTTSWENMTAVDGGYYLVPLNTSATYVIFCRMNPNTSDNSWNNKWNQTGDLTIPTDGKNLFTVPDGAWDGSTSTWSTYVHVEPTYVVAGSAGLCGSEWNGTDDNNKMEKQADGTYKKVYANVAAGSYELKVVRDGSTWIPDSNVPVTAKEDATVTVTFNPSTNGVTAVAEGGTDPIVPVEHDYYVVGEGSIFGDTTWGDATIDANKMEKQSDGTYKKVYTVATAGTISLKVHDPLLGDSGWWGDNDSNISVTAKQGATLTVTFNAETKAVSAVAEGGTDPIVPVDPVYRVAGSAGLCGSEWNGTDDNNKMEKQADGTYKKVYTDVAAGTYELKVVMDGSTWIPGGTGNDISVTALEGATVTVTYDPNNTATPVTAVAEGGTEPSTPTEDTYHLVGSGSVFSAEWSTDGGFLLTKGSDGKYTKVFENVAAGELGFKVVKNNETWIPEGMGNETKVTAKQGATVTVVFDPADNSITATAVGGTDSDDDDDDQGGTVTPPPATNDVYHVVGSGSIFGGEQWNASDANLMTKGADGKYTKTYTAPGAGNIGIKILKNGTDYIPDGMGNEITKTVKNGSTVTVTYDPSKTGADAISVTVTGGSDAVVIDPNAKYYVAGVKELCGSEWNASDANNLMTVNTSTGTYSITYKDLLPNTRYAFKVTNGTWDKSWPGQDREFAVAEKGNVTITFNPATGEVTLSANAIKYVPEIKDTDKLVVAGTSGLCGSEWNATDANNQLVKGADGSYTITYKNVAKGDYELKVVLNGSTWIGGSDGNNVKFTVGAVCDVTVSYTPAGGIKVTGASVTVHVPEVPSNGDETNLFGMVVVTMAAVLGMGITVLSKKKFF